MSLSVSSAFASNTNTESSNIALIKKQYHDIYENKEFDKMDRYFSKDIVYYKNFNQPLHYDTYRQYLIKQKEECTKTTLFPLHQIFASGNRVVTLNTRHCTGPDNQVHQRRVMAINELNAQHHISKIWVITTDE